MGAQAAKDVRADAEANKKRGRPRKSDGGDRGDEEEEEEGRKKPRANQRSAVGEDGTWRPHLPLKR